MRYLATMLLACLMISAMAAQGYAVTCTCSCNISKPDLRCHKRLTVSGKNPRRAAIKCARRTAGFGHTSDCH
jgi:hypothetical protein